MRGFPPGFSFSVFAKRGRAASEEKGEKKAAAPACRTEETSRGAGEEEDRECPTWLQKNGARKERDRERAQPSRVVVFFIRRALLGVGMGDSSCAAAALFQKERNPRLLWTS